MAKMQMGQCCCGGGGGGGITECCCSTLSGRDAELVVSGIANNGSCTVCANQNGTFTLSPSADNACAIGCSCRCWRYSFAAFPASCSVVFDRLRWDLQMSCNIGAETHTFIATFTNCLGSPTIWGTWSATVAWADMPTCEFDVVLTKVSADSVCNWPMTVTVRIL